MVKNELNQLLLKKRKKRSYELSKHIRGIKLPKKCLLKYLINSLSDTCSRTSRDLFYQRVALKNECFFKWNSDNNIAKLQFSLNFNHNNKTRYNLLSRTCEYKVPGIPLLTSCICDSFIKQTQDSLRLSMQEANVSDIRCLNKSIKPIAALNCLYEDPYCNIHAETKVLGIRGINSIVISRSSIYCKQLAKKMAFEMNCVYLDPMQMLQSFYHIKEKGFYIPSKIKELFKEFYILKYIERRYEISKNKNDEETKHWSQNAEHITLARPNEEKPFETTRQVLKETKISGTESRSSRLDIVDKRKWYVPLLHKRDFPRRDEIPSTDTDITDSASEHVSNETEGAMKIPESCINDKVESTYFYECKSRSRISELMSTESVEFEDDEVISFETLKSLLQKPLPRRSLRKLHTAIVTRNIQFRDDVWSSLLDENVKSNTCYTKGYVLAGYPIFFRKRSNDILYWKSVFRSCNPPDYVVCMQCQEDETMGIYEAIRVNPFLHCELYNYHFLKHAHNFYNIYKESKVIEFPDVVNTVYEDFSEHDIPRIDSFVLGYYECLHRTSVLRVVDENKSVPHRKPHPRRFYTEGETFYEEPDLIYGDLNLNSVKTKTMTGRFLPLELYVKIPKYTEVHRVEENVYFNFQAVLINLFVQTYLPSYVLKSDVMTAMNYQFSIIKRWFDYSGFYSKPRAKAGNIALISITCELIARAKNKEKFEAEFMREFTAKYNALVIPNFGEYAEEEDVFASEIPAIENFGEAEEGVYEPPSSTISSKSFEFGVSERHPEKDVFYFLKNAYEDDLSYIADEYELNFVDDLSFYKTYQCYLSTWNDRCPVAHYYNMSLRGLLEYSVRLHDKVYFLSSNQAMKSFMADPSKYLVPPLPESQCQVLILGPPRSGKTYVAEALAKFFGAYVINFKEVIEMAKRNQKHKYIQTIDEQISPLIFSILQEDISRENYSQILECTKWLEKAYQLVLFRTEVFRPHLWDIYLPENNENADDLVFTIPEYYPSNFDISYLLNIITKSNTSTIAMDIILNTCKMLTNDVIQPYFLKDRNDAEIYLDIFLDNLLREQFKEMNLLDIYGSFDACEMYSSKPYRLLERLPIELLPSKSDFEELMTTSELEQQFLNNKDDFLINAIDLSSKEKIDALGSVIISIEDLQRKESVLRYGGWIIDDMPNEMKLLKALDNAGLFPRNIIFMENHESQYDSTFEHHSSKEGRNLDLEKNLTCYVFPELRHSVNIEGNNVFFGNNQTDEIKQEDTPREHQLNLSHCSGDIIARLNALCAFSEEGKTVFEQGSDFSENTNDWPGKYGMKSNVTRSYLYEPLIADNKYDELNESGFSTLYLLDLLNILYHTLERQLKPLGCLGLIHSSIVEMNRPFLYYSIRFNRCSQPKQRVLRLLNSFYLTLNEDRSAPSRIELISFSFKDNDSAKSSQPLLAIEKQDGFPYLNHLAYALEVSMLLDDKNNDNLLLENIHNKLLSMGYNFDILKKNEIPVEEFIHPSCEKDCDKTDSPVILPFEKNKYQFLKLNLFSSYFLDKMFATKDRVVSVSLNKITSINSMNKVDIIPTVGIQTFIETNESILPLLTKLHASALKDTRKSRKHVKDLLKLLFSALKSVFELDCANFLILDDDDRHSLLYFPRNMGFLKNEEKVYDIYLMCNKLLRKLPEKTNDPFNFNPIITLLKCNAWNDWFYNEIEDYNCYFKLFFRNPSKNAVNIADSQKCLNKEKEMDIVTLRIIKKICLIQAEINLLQNIDKSFISNEELAIINYFIWLRDNLIQKSGLIDYLDLFKTESPSSPNFPDWIPSFSEIYGKFSYNTRSREQEDTPSRSKKYFSRNEKNTKIPQKEDLLESLFGEIKTSLTNKERNCNKRENLRNSNKNSKHCIQDFSTSCKFTNNKNFCDNKSDNIMKTDIANNTTEECGYSEKIEPELQSAEIWPFRSNWTNRPAFIGLYDTYVWNELSKIPRRRYEFGSCQTVLKKKLSEKVIEELYIEEVKQSSKAVELNWTWVNDKAVLLNETNTVFKFDQNAEDSRENSKIKSRDRASTKKIFPESKLYPIWNEDIENIGLFDELKEQRKSLNPDRSVSTFFGYSLEDKPPRISKNINLNAKAALRCSYLLTDGRQKNYPRSTVRDEFGRFRDIVELKTFVFGSFNATRLSWICLDQYGPYKMLYYILDLIKGSKMCAHIAKNDIFCEISDDEVADEELFQMEEHSLQEEPSSEVVKKSTDFEEEALMEESASVIQEETSFRALPIKFDKDKICIVSLFDGYLRNGSDGLVASYRGQEYCFCSQECLVRFRWHPERFVNILNPMEAALPLNIFYSEIPGGLGKHISCTACYFFGLPSYYLDDYITLRLGPVASAIEDLKALAIIINLKNNIAANWDHNSQLKNFLLKNYLLMKKEIPNFKCNIDHFKKDNKTVCLYNFPQHPKNYNEIAKESIIPLLVLHSNPVSMSLISEYQAYDIIDNFIGYLLCEKLKFSQRYTDQFIFWAKVWKSRFLRILKYLKAEDKLILKLQLRLLDLRNNLLMGSTDVKGALVHTKEWSDTSAVLTTSSGSTNNFNINDNHDSMSGSKDKIKTKNDKFANEPSIFSDTKRINNPILNNSNPAKEENCKMLSENRLAKLWRHTLKAYTANENSSISKDNLLFTFKSLQKLLEFQKSEALRLMSETNSDLIISKVIQDEEENLKDEVLSVDSVGFDDSEKILDLKENFTSENFLKYLAVCLKHTNILNPMPIPFFDSEFGDVSAEEITNLLKIVLENMAKSLDKCQGIVPGTNFSEVDFVDGLTEDVLDEINKARKPLKNAECVIEIQKSDVLKLLKTGYYFLSNFGFTCPVQAKKRRMYPHKRILYDFSNCYPVAHRRYIYFTESLQALERFKNSPLDYTNKAEHRPVVPIKIVIFGPNTQRTMKIVNALCNEFSMEHITVSTAIEYYTKVAPWTRLGQKLKWLISFVYTLSYPMPLPMSLVWQAVESMTLTPKSTTHGFIITGLSPEVDLFRQWERTEFRPHLIFYFTMMDIQLFCCQQVQKMKLISNKISKYQRNVEEILKYYLESSYEFMKNQCNLWRQPLHKTYIHYLKTYYYNVHHILYETSSFITYEKISTHILEVFNTIKVLYKTIFKEPQIPVPIGKLLSANEKNGGLKFMYDSCLLCFCTNLRTNNMKGSKDSKRHVFLLKDKLIYVCSKHANSLLMDHCPGSIPLIEDIEDHASTNDTDTLLEDKITFSGLCPVCYWLYKPHEELRYRVGSNEYTSVWNGSVYLFCSTYCLKEFESAPYLYGLPDKLYDARQKTDLNSDDNYPFDITFWNPKAFKAQANDTAIGRYTQSVLFQHLLRMSILLEIRFPGWTQREARIFFIYVMTQCYLSTRKSLEHWRMVLCELLHLSGTSKRILNQFMAVQGKDLPDLIELLVARM